VRNWREQIGESVILKDELGERGAVERSTTIYRDCFRPRQMDPVPVELRSSAVASRMRETTFRLDDGRPAVYSRASSDAFRPNFDHRNNDPRWLHTESILLYYY